MLAAKVTNNKRRAKFKEGHRPPASGYHCWSCREKEKNPLDFELLE